LITREAARKWDYKTELSFLETYYNRNLVIAKLVNKATRKYGNSLVTYTTIKHGQLLLELILEDRFGIEYAEVLEKVTPQRLKKLEYVELDRIFLMMRPNEREMKYLRKRYKEEQIKNIRVLEDYDIFLIKGSVEGEQRNAIRHIVETKSNAIILGSNQTVSTGINIKRLHNIFSTAPTKSSIRLNQTIGRGMRKHDEKAKMRFFDFVDDLSSKRTRVRKNYALKHAYERMDEYLEHGYPIKEIEIEIKENE
jgi:hypothetical protein